MKKFLGLLCLVCFSSMTLAFADEAVTTNANQEVDIDCAGAVAMILKQPRAQENVQVIKVHRSGLVLVLSIAGKVPNIQSKTTEK